MKRLTKRELEIEMLLYTKKSMDMITSELGIHRETVESHCVTIFEFYQVDDRRDLMTLKIIDLQELVEIADELDAGTDW